MIKATSTRVAETDASELRNTPITHATKVMSSKPEKTPGKNTAEICPYARKANRQSAENGYITTAATDAIPAKASAAMRTNLTLKLARKTAVVRSTDRESALSMPVRLSSWFRAGFSKAYRSCTLRVGPDTLPLRPRPQQLSQLFPGNRQANSGFLRAHGEPRPERHKPESCQHEKRISKRQDSVDKRQDSADNY